MPAGDPDKRFDAVTGERQRFSSAILRYHVDIETDDLDAEVARLLSLGAVEVSRWLDCHVLHAPGAHLLCVVPVHSDADFFDAHARTWS